VASIEAVAPKLKGMPEFVGQSAQGVASQMLLIVIVTHMNRDQQGAALLITTQQSSPHRRAQILTFTVDEPDTPGEHGAFLEQSLACGVVPEMGGLVEAPTEIHFATHGGGRCHEDRILAPVHHPAVMERSCHFEQEMKQIPVVS